MFFIAGGSLAFFFEFLLLSKRNKSLADIILAIWMLAFGINLFLVYFSFARLDLKYTFLLGLGNPFPFLHHPMLYLYTLALTDKIRRFKSIYLLHFVPFLFFYIYYASYFTLNPVEKIAFIDKFKAGYHDFYSRYSYFGMLVSATTYTTLNLFLLKKHSREIKSFYSYSNEKINLYWLRNLLIGVSAIWIIAIIFNLIFESNRADYFIYSTVVLFIISLGYFGIKQANIFVQSIETDPENCKKIEPSEKNQKRYAKSGLKEVDTILIKEKLRCLMEEEKLYLEEALSLGKLAEKVDILPNYLSQVINERFDKNFYDFVNSYRVDEFKKLVENPKNRNKTILALAFDSGFSSKASFNNFFKKQTGQTPTEYINSSKKINE